MIILLIGLCAATLANLIFTIYVARQLVEVLEEHSARLDTQSKRTAALADTVTDHQAFVDFMMENAEPCDEGCEYCDSEDDLN